MLWYKAWLETRYRFIFVVASAALLWLAVPFIGAPPEVYWRGVQLAATLMFCFAAAYLAGSGVNSQTIYAATSGFHGSMLFTLSLPVPRRRLFLVRAGLGAIETGVFVILAVGITLMFRPEATSAAEALRYGFRAVVCSMSVYALSALLACILDEVWQFMGAIILLGALALVQSKVAAVAAASPLRGMHLMSYPLEAPLPWAALAASVAASAVLLYAAVLTLERKQY